MPMADEATEFTRKLVDKKVVRVKLLRRDQYNRAVAKVFVKCVSKICLYFHFT
jgi:endonuclease YncB( thermonuclease family)